MEGNPYDGIAPVYDAWTGSAPVTRENLGFYVEECTGEPGVVVELGVANGRIALEVARKGKAIVGVDASRAMLELCRERARAEGLEDLVALLHADFRDFELPEKASLATIPFHTIGALVTAEDRRTALRHVRGQLVPGGRLVFDHFVFDPVLAARSDGVQELRGEFRAASGRDALLWATSRYDLERRVIRLVARAEELEPDGRVAEARVSRLELAWLDPEEVRALLEETGFEVEALYGGFDRSAFTGDSPMQVWSARRS